MITIVSIPQINLLTEVADTILCKQEALDLTIFNTENNVYYSLYKFGSSTNYGSSENGNGSDLNFQTNVLSQAGIYYIRANSSVANCFRNFTDTITITVEKPISRIYFDIINAEVNEDVRFISDLWRPVILNGILQIHLYSLLPIFPIRSIHLQESVHLRLL